jgi:RNA polymerase sigma-70 factor (ECF subfamily)
MAFRTTRWTVVLAAAQGDSPSAEEALAQVCRTYWYPLYAFVRRRGYDAHEAQDLTQEFFARLLEKNGLNSVDRAKGQFRSFLLAALKHFLDNEWDKAQTQKRGGQYEFVPWDEFTGEDRYGQEPFHELTAEKIFDRRWALTVLETVMEELRKEYTVAGRQALFEAFQVFLSGETATSTYAELGANLTMNEGAVKVAVHRLRRRYGELLRSEIAHTVGSPREIDEEMRHLIAALG